MPLENRFNLIDEPWIPIVDVGRVSLKQIFSNSEYRALGGNPVQKIALTKLLLAIAQAAYTPADDDEWATLGADGMAKKCLDYLEKWHDRFWLYGEKPFLQMPNLTGLVEQRKVQELQETGNKNKQIEAEKRAMPKAIGSAFYPDLPADNNTILIQSQFERVLSDAEKAVFIVSLMNFAFGGKRVEKNLSSLTPNYAGKSVSAKAAPSLGNYIGYLHSFIIGEDLLDTIRLNLFTKDEIEKNKFWMEKLGISPWELMPEGEDCDTAKRLKKSYMGCLVAMSRFVLLKEDRIYYIEGIQYPSHKEGWREPSITVNEQGKSVKLLWVDPDKRPWRELVSLLSFISTAGQGGYDCQQIKFGLLRARSKNKTIGIWSGGLRVTSNSGDQSVKQNDDFVESQIMLSSEMLDRVWYEQLKHEMSGLDNLSKVVYSATINYFKTQNMDGKKKANLASNLYWQLCEHKFQDLVNACGNQEREIELKKIRTLFANCVNKAYDTFCPKDTSRQLDAWAKNRPNLGKYLS